MEAVATEGRSKHRKLLEPGIKAKVSSASSIAKQYV